MPRVKADLHPRKIILWVWWNQKGISLYELLPSYWALFWTTLSTWSSDSRKTISNDSAVKQCSFAYCKYDNGSHSGARMGSFFPIMLHQNTTSSIFFFNNLRAFPSTTTLRSKIGFTTSSRTNQQTFSSERSKKWSEALMNNAAQFIIN